MTTRAHAAAVWAVCILAGWAALAAAVWLAWHLVVSTF